MGLYNSDEAAEIVGVSRIRLTQLIRPDSFTAKEGCGGKRGLYTRETIDDFIVSRKEQGQIKRRKMILRELEGTIRPSAEYLTITEAAEFCGREKGVISHNVKPKYSKGKMFYRQRDLLNIPVDARPRPKGDIGKQSGAICECGRMFTRSLSEPECPVCMHGVDKEDVDNVKIVRKKGTRKCPVCGKVLFVGQYTCGNPTCVTEVQDDLGALDIHDIYGGIRL